MTAGAYWFAAIFAQPFIALAGSGWVRWNAR